MTAEPATKRQTGLETAPGSPPIGSFEVQSTGVAVGELGWMTLLVGKRDGGKDEALEHTARSARAAGLAVERLVYETRDPLRAIEEAIERAAGGVVVAHHTLDGLHHTEVEDAVEKTLWAAQRHRVQLLMPTERHDCVEAFACLGPKTPAREMIRLEGPHEPEGAQALRYTGETLAYIAHGTVECR